MEYDGRASNSGFGKGCDKFSEVLSAGIGDGQGKCLQDRFQVVAERANLDGSVEHCGKPSPGPV